MTEGCAAVEVRVSSWEQLQVALFQDMWNPELERWRSRAAFLGLSDVNYELETTPTRLGGPYPSLERHLLRNFIQYAHEENQAE